MFPRVCLRQVGLILEDEHFVAIAVWAECNDVIVGMELNVIDSVSEVEFWVVRHL